MMRTGWDNPEPAAAPAAQPATSDIARDIALAAMGAGPLAGKSQEELEALAAQHQQAAQPAAWQGQAAGAGAWAGGGGGGGGGWDNSWSGGGGSWGSSWGGGGGWGGPDTPQKLALIDRVKEWQRTSPAHKIAWDNFCLTKGSDKFDPSRKAEDFLQEFVHLADAGMITLENPDSTCSQHEKVMLVDRVKQWQRLSPSHKQAWWTFCWTQGSKDFDPARHSGATLQMFLTGVDSGEIQPETPWMDMKGGDKGGDGKGKGKDKGFMMMMFQMMKGKMKGKGKGSGEGAAGDGAGYGAYGDAAAAVGAGAGLPDAQGAAACAGACASAAAADTSGCGDPYGAYGAACAAGFGGCGDMGAKGGWGGPAAPSTRDIAAAAAFAAAAANAPQVTKEAEIRMEDAIAAKAAVDHLNGTALMGGVLTVEWDTSSGMNTKLIVKGVPAIAGWQEVKDHFKVAGTVAFAKIKGEDEGPTRFGCGKGGPVRRGPY